MAKSPRKVRHRGPEVEAATARERRRAEDENVMIDSAGRLADTFGTAADTLTKTLTSAVAGALTTARELNLPLPAAKARPSPARPSPPKPAAAKAASRTSAAKSTTSRAGAKKQGAATKITAAAKSSGAKKSAAAPRRRAASKRRAR